MRRDNPSAERRLHIVVNDQRLRGLMVASLRRARLQAKIEESSFRRADRGDVVIALTADCTPARCAELRTRGVAIIVVAGIPSASERLAYLSAGATAYVRAETDGAALVDAVAIAVGTFLP